MRKRYLFFDIDGTLLAGGYAGYIPVSAKRVVELEEFTKDCPYGIVYVTAFPNAKEFKKHVDDIAWETEVWLSDTPDHMIHFNGDRFIGPRK